MKPFWRYTLYKVKKSTGPTPAFRRALNMQLKQAWEAQYGTARAPLGWFWQRYALAGILAALVLAGTATGAYAYVSPQVTEGTPLYPLKKGIERVEERLQNTPDRKAKFYLKKLERREREVQILTRKDKLADKTKAEIDTTAQQLEKYVTGNAKQLKSVRLQEKIKKRLDIRKQKQSDIRTKRQEQINKLKRL